MHFEPEIGIGLRAAHYSEVLLKKPSIGWLEVHSENFFYKGSSAWSTLSEIRQYYPVSLHGVGLSLGSADGIAVAHLQRLKNLMEEVEPLWISEHLSWSAVKGIHLPDLLPLPYTQESLECFCGNVSRVQEFLGRQLLIENPSSYFEYPCSEQEESAFLVSLCQQTGAGILLDVNNVFVSANNHGWDPKRYIDQIPKTLVKEIHLAGHSTRTLSNGTLLRIDTHDRPIINEVWSLYEYALSRFGKIHTLIEWDAQLPPLDTLLKEAQRAQHYLAQLTDTADAC